MFDLQGHRGARGLFPENTLEGFQACLAMGIDSFELDVGMTVDGVVVVHHDLRLNPDIARDPDGNWIDGPGPLIRGLTFSALSRWDVGGIRPGTRYRVLYPDQQPRVGARIPTLATVLAGCPTARFNVEIKTDPRHPDWTARPEALAEAVLAVIEEAGAAARVMVESFDWRGPRHLRRLRPGLRLAWLTRAETVRDHALWWAVDTVPTTVPAAIAAEGGQVWAPEHTDLAARDVAEAHALGLQVMPWTVNRPEAMRRLIAWGVDGLISDRPDLARPLLPVPASPAAVHAGYCGNSR